MTVAYPAFGPIHRLGLKIIRDWFAGMEVDGRPITIGSRIPADMSDSIPFIMVRAEKRSGKETTRSNDERFLRASQLSIETFTSGVNAENDGYDIQESCRLAIWNAWSEQIVVPDAGSIASVIRTSGAALVSDYATSTGVVQYASLPKAAARTEASFELMIRPPEQSTIVNPFIPKHSS